MLVYGSILDGVWFVSSFIPSFVDPTIPTLLFNGTMMMVSPLNMERWIKLLYIQDSNLLLGIAPSSKTMLQAMTMEPVFVFNIIFRVFTSTDIRRVPTDV